MYIHACIHKRTHQLIYIHECICIHTHWQNSRGTETSGAQTPLIYTHRCIYIYENSKMYTHPQKCIYTGVLGLAALKFGAAEAAGVEIDPDSIAAAHSNAGFIYRALLQILRTLLRICRALSPSCSFSCSMYIY